MASREEKKHFWHILIVLLLVLIGIGTAKIYRSQQDLKKMVSEGFIQMKEAMSKDSAKESKTMLPLMKDSKTMKKY